MTIVIATGRVRIEGPLAEHVQGFEAELRRLGFSPASVVNQLRLVAHLSRWLDAQELEVECLSAEWVEVFTRERRSSYTGLFSRRALRPLLDWLAASGMITAEAARPIAPDDPVVLGRFEEYLLTERRLQPGTTAAHVSRVRRFLNGYTPAGGLGQLSAGEVTRALLDEGQGRAPVSVKKFGFDLRRMGGQTPPLPGLPRRPGDPIHARH